MSVVFRCDGCGRVAVGDYDGFYWKPPETWRYRTFDDFEIHGCSTPCLDKVMERRGGITPTNGYEKGFNISDFKKAASEKPPEPNTPVAPKPAA